MTSANTPPTKRRRTTRKRPGRGATAANLVFFLVIVALTYIYQSVAWLLILVGTVLVVASVVMVVQGEPEGALALALGAIGLGSTAAGVVLVLILIRKLEYRFWETIPFLPGPGF
jgi:hypothetical protein